MWARANYCVSLPVCWFACLVVCQFPFVVRGEWDYLLFNGARVQAGWALAFLATSQLDLSLPRWRTLVPLTDSMLWWPCSDSSYWEKRSHLFFFFQETQKSFIFWKLKSFETVVSMTAFRAPGYMFNYWGETPPGKCIEWFDGSLGWEKQTAWGGRDCQVHGSLHQVFNNQLLTGEIKS